MITDDDNRNYIIRYKQRNDRLFHRPLIVNYRRSFVVVPQNTLKKNTARSTGVPFPNTDRFRSAPRIRAWVVRDGTHRTHTICIRYDRSGGGDYP